MIVWGILVVTMAAAGQQQPPVSDAELSQHLGTVRAQLNNAALDLGRREALAQDMAATLDRAAISSPDPEQRRKRWAEAIDLIDQFTRANPEAGLDRPLRFQAAVFRWAQAQTWVQAAAFEPTNPRHHERAEALLDDAIERLRSIAAVDDRTTLGENLRFRLAQALADRSELDPAGSAPRNKAEKEAMDLLERPPAELGLGGFWHLLKAELFLRAARPADARKELDAALLSKPAPPADELTAVRVPLLLGEGQFDEALKSVEGARLDAAVKGLWRVRIRLAQLTRTPESEERRRAHAELFREIRGFKGSRASEARLALLELARAGVEPAEGEPPDAWDALADAYQAAGEPAKAASAEGRAADRAASAGQADAAAGYRLRSGALSFQAGRYADADAALTRVVDDPKAGSARARAGMLRALARGRAIAANQRGASAAAYADALERQVRDFPDDPVTHEARWLLGDLLQSASDRNLKRARDLWTAIPPGAPRWLASRLAIAELDRDDLDRQLINPDRRQLTETFAAADRFLGESVRQSRSDEDTAHLLIARARLNLVPTVGSAEAARDYCDRVARLPVSSALQYRARLLRMIAQVELGRYLEAERDAQTHGEWDISGEHAALFDAIRLLDQGATIASTDLRQRRLGLVLKLLIESVLNLDAKFPPGELSELKMRLTRALLFVGQDRDARRSLLDWRGSPPLSSDRLLRDLGDTYSRLEAYSLDIDVERLRIKNSAAGSLPWFDARYALALSYYHTGQYKLAASLIDATAILHPELGGGELHEKFIRLRQRLGEKP